MGFGASKYTTETTEIVGPEPVYSAKHGGLTAFPDELIDESRTDIKTVNLSSNLIQEISDEIVELTGLRHVDLSNNQLRWISYEFFELPYLSHVNLSANNLDRLDGIGTARKLQYLNISQNRFSILSGELFKVVRLLHLLVADNNLSQFPVEIRRLQQLRSLDWSRNGVVSINEGVFATMPRTLKVLKLGTVDLEMCVLNLSVVQKIGTRMKFLEELDFSNNHMDKDVVEGGQGALHTIALMTRLKYLNAENNDIKTVPDTFGNLVQLRVCILNNNTITSLPVASFKNLTRMKRFEIDNNAVDGVEAIPFRKTEMRSLSAKNNSISYLPGQVAQPHLESLNLENNELKVIDHVDFKRMSKLKTLSLKDNHIEKLPDSLCHAKNLEHLDLEGNKIAHIPEDLNLKKLGRLNLSNNNLESLPVQIQRFNRLVDVDLSGNKITDTDLQDISGDENEAMHLKRISLKDNEVESVPEMCFNSIHLEELDIGGNNVKEIPEQIQTLKKLQSLKIENNDIIIVPAHVFKHPSLQELAAKGNRIHTISMDTKSQEQSTSLQTLDVSDNRLRSVPKAMESLQSLKKVDVSDNQLYFLPSVLVNLEDTSGAEVSVSGNLLRDVPKSDDAKTLKEMVREIQNKPEAPELSKIRRGKIFFIGKQGAGKATLMRNLLALSDRPPGEFKHGESDLTVEANTTDDTNKGEENSQHFQEGNEVSEHQVTEDCQDVHIIKKKVLDKLAFMDRVIWPIEDDIDIELTYCSGSGNVNLVYPLFYTENSLYVLTVNLLQYKPSSDDSFHQCIGLWIKDILASIGGEVLVVIIGTHTDRLTKVKLEEASGSIRIKVEKLLSEYQRRQSKALLISSSPKDIITIGKNIDDNQMYACRDKLCEIVSNTQNRLLPGVDSSLYRNGVAPSVFKLLQVEKLLVEMRDDDDPIKRVALTLSQFGEVLEKVGLKTEDTGDIIAYLKRIGVLQQYVKISSLKGYIFHNLDFLRDVLQAIFEKSQDSFLDVKSFPPGYRSVRFSVVKEAFDNKAVLSDDVIRECVLGHLDLDDDVISLVFDMLIGFNICYEVPAEANKDAFLHSEGDGDGILPRILRFPAYLKKAINNPWNFKPVLETLIEFPWYYPSRLKSVLVCNIHKNVREEGMDSAHVVFQGVGTMIIQQKGPPKTLMLRTVMVNDPEHTFSVLNGNLMDSLREGIKNTWSSLTYSIHMRVICPAGVGCKHPYSAVHHSWKSYPKDESEVSQIMNECKYRKEGVPDHAVAQRMVSTATDIISTKLDPQKWKDLAPHLGIPEEKVKIIEKQRDIDMREKLKLLLGKWKERIQTPAIVKPQAEKLTTALKVIGERDLATEISDLDLDNLEMAMQE
ncbi:uncharacterized protein LOC144446238 [Glandiceps talaboti]